MESLPVLLGDGQREGEGKEREKEDLRKCVVNE